MTNDKSVYEKAQWESFCRNGARDYRLFCAAAIAQMFASTLSLLKGNNPDAPRGLKKVTITNDNPQGLVQGTAAAVPCRYRWDFTFTITFPKDGRKNL